MTTLGIEDFDDFFAEVNNGNQPFTWQVNLLRYLGENGRWPSSIVAPTGAGKSSAVDVHVFASALSALGVFPPLPRRLGVVVNRRGLVDHHAVHAEQITRALEARGGVAGQVTAALAPLSLRAEPLLRVNLRGGLARDSSWIDDPSACAVIAATPDMWGSRLLFRGYGSAPHARPREAGLLAYDSTLLLDESHLNRQLAHTASDIAWLAGRHAEDLGVPPLQVTAMTATPPGDRLDQDWVGVDLEHLADARDEPLRRRLHRPKPLVYCPVGAWPGAARTASDRYIDALATHALQVRQEVGIADPSGQVAGTVGCFVNQVDTAVRLAEALAQKVGDQAVVCWVGRMRPFDLDQLRQEQPDLFTVRGDDRIAFLVATQTVEVGVDIDVAGLVTELADGSALAQRAGRVNRLGLRGTTQIRVIGPAEVSGDSLPYRQEDLQLAQQWVIGRQDDQGLSAVALAADPAPSPELRRLALSDVSGAHGRLLASTSNELFAEPDLSFWLRDDLETEREPVTFVVRAGLPMDDVEAQALLDLAPPADAEGFPATIKVARQVLEVALGPALSAVVAPPRCFRWRNGAAEPVVAPDRIRPGDVLILDEGHRLTRRGVVVPDTKAAEPIRTFLGEGVVGVLIHSKHEDRFLPPRLWGANGDRTDAEEAAVSGDGDYVLEALAGVSSDEVQATFLGLMRAAYGSVADNWEIFLAPVTDDNDIIPWAVIRETAALSDDPELRQEWSIQRHRVSLDQHQQAVAERAGRLADLIGLPAHLAQVLRQAGLHHDDGKADLRFQRQVLRGDGVTLLAKSGDSGAQRTRRARSRSTLPPGWRHEQVSAAMVWARAGTQDHRALVTRLVGTSHGRGRPFFPYGTSTVTDSKIPAALAASDVEHEQLAAAAADLFASGGGWDDVLTTTARAFGEWGCAYLEAILRAADCTVSKEGS